MKRWNKMVRISRCPVLPTPLFLSICSTNTLSSILRFPLFHYHSYSPGRLDCELSTCAPQSHVGPNDLGDYSNNHPTRNFNYPRNIAHCSSCFYAENSLLTSWARLGPFGQASRSGCLLWGCWCMLSRILVLTRAGCEESCVNQNGLQA
ncbi:uncharacterized protein EI90DRAFT_3089715 [Cantharellus anzutake]|uniref:uncharacterized protein n=1 Tax=Cantharellus anzutake TaxID=1750568 RepID=UPI00190435D7|nr:uncharacterized protein EI90DRAFT_3089715 [Cantharellus anzutake]KAF8314623.1 hypothetical protein EI90DRAFT_3089715 [Cantharellus anzutake]